MFTTLTLFIILFSLVLWLVYSYHQYRANYWHNLGFPTLPSANILFGHFTQAAMLRKGFADGFRETHSAFKRAGCKIGGLFMVHLPLLQIVDADLAKRILQTDFDCFEYRGIDPDPRDEMQLNLVGLDGAAWRALRRKLSPTFTSGKLKMMFPLIEQHIDVMIDVISKKRHVDDIQLYDYLSKCGIDIIGHVAFGLDCNTLKDQNKIFCEMSRRIFNPRSIDLIKIFLTELKNPTAIIKLTTSDREAMHFFQTTVRETVAYRRIHKLKANDFLQLLIDHWDEGSGEGFTMSEITVHAFLFFVAGFETSATAVNYTVYLLAKHREIQQRLREIFQKELSDNNNVWTYDLVMNCEYLNMVLKESLRMYPPVIAINRKCVRDYMIPESGGMVIPKDTFLIMSTLGFHYDVQYFRNPDVFDPERFSKEIVDQIKSFAYIPFGEGPRLCIGKRFAYLQSKMEVMKLIMNFDVSLSANMKPLRTSPISKTMMLNSEYPILLNFKPINR